MQSINLPSILTPDAGLLFWMLLAFLVVFFFVAKFGFPVIIKMVEERKNYIDEALGKAREANEKLADIQLESERMLNETRNQQAEILKQAKQSGENIIQQAREKAQNESAAMMQEAKKQIEAEKENALREIRQTVADLSVIIAEKVVRQHLADQTSQQQLIEKLLDESLKENWAPSENPEDNLKENHFSDRWLRKVEKGGEQNHLSPSFTAKYIHSHTLLYI